MGGETWSRTTMVIIATVVGCALVLLALFDVFESLFHPAGRGTLSDWIARAIWRVVRFGAKRRPWVITYAGPIAFTTIVGSWVTLVVIGCSLIFWPHMRTGFVSAPGLDPNRYVGFFDAFNTSLGTLINFSNDVYATEKWIRLVMGMEGVIGFGLLTASVSWLLSLYPVLETRRALAQEATLLHHSEQENGIDLTALPASEAFSALQGLTAQLTSLRNQVAQFPITYYFHIGEKETALPGVIPYLAELALRASKPNRDASVRLAGTALGGAVESYLNLIATVYLRMATDDQMAIMKRHAEDQLRQMVVDRGQLRAA